LLSAIVIAVLSLSKTSFFFAAAPLFVLADLYRCVRKRSLPLQTLVYLMAIVATFLATGQSLASLPLYLRNAYEVSSFYSQAMGTERDAWKIVTMQLPFIASVIGLLALLLLRSVDGLKRKIGFFYANVETLAVMMMGLLWLAFVMCKASYVRHDRDHYFIGWNGLLLIAPVVLHLTSHLLGGMATLKRSELTFIAAACAVFFVTTDARTWWEFRSQGIGRLVQSRVTEKINNVRALAGWANPQKVERFERARVEALQRIAVRDFRPAGGTVDVYPYEVGPAIAAGLDYQPRPTLQSYMAFAPYLQKLDLEHWRGSHAPAHILFELSDISGRLPTMALGPSIVEILSRYDAVGRFGSYIHLQKRKFQRPLVRQVLTSNRVALDEWIPVPKSEGALTLATIRLQPTIFGRLLEFVDKPPILSIHTRYSSGEMRSFRFIPSMTELGFAISPDLEPLLGRDGHFEAELIEGLKQSAPIEALRISGGPLAHSSFQSGTATFSAVQFK
jgi:hypothetical protein